MAGDSASETAIDNIESSGNGLIGSEPDLGRASGELWSQHAEAGDPNLRSDFPDDPGDRSAMSIGVFAFAFGKFAEIGVVHDKVVVELPATKIGMSNLDT